MNMQQLLEAVERFLDKGGEPRDPNEATFSVSFDGGKTFKELGSGCIGEIRIVRPDEPPQAPK